MTGWMDGETDGLTDVSGRFLVFFSQFFFFLVIESGMYGLFTFFFFFIFYFMHLIRLTFIIIIFFLLGHRVFFV